MNLDDTPSAQTYREDVRDFLRSHLPDGWRGIGALSGEEIETFSERWRELLIERRLLALDWPEEYGGGGLTNLEQAIVFEEFAAAGVPLYLHENDVLGFLLLGNTLIELGTPEQKQHFLPRIISGEHRWCQGFSEPGAGSDLAGVSTHARLDGDEWVINGQKVWTSSGQTANWIFVLVRTDPDTPKHRGLSFLLVPLDQPGVEVRPIEQLNGDEEFNETFFTDARTAASNVVGPVNAGWQVAMTLLGFERGGNAPAMAIRFRVEFQRLLDLVQERGLAHDPDVRRDIAERFVDLEIMRLLAMRTISNFVAEEPPGPESSIAKLYWSEYWQSVTRLALRIVGPEALTPTHHRPPSADGPDRSGAPNDSGSWVGSYFNSFAGTIYNGTSEIQRNIVAERVLGLPRDPFRG